MIYTFGCSLCKWYWPTWSDWLKHYGGHDVKNLGRAGIGPHNIYWTLVNTIDDMTEDDEVIIMWMHSHRMMQWYDQRWIEEKDVWGFFPNQDGDLWYTKDQKWLGLYRTHPEHLFSLAHGIIETINLIHICQNMLTLRGIKYRMVFGQNLWLDVRPEYGEKFRMTWHDRDNLNDKEKELALGIMALDPVTKLIDRIDWSSFVDGPSDIRNPSTWNGLMEYISLRKEYIALKHTTDNHPSAIVHHDYALEKFLDLDPLSGQHRSLALDISEDAQDIEIPDFEEFVSPAEGDILLTKYKERLK